MINVTIPNWRPHSINQLLHGHWTKARRMKRQDADMIMAYLVEHPKATGRRRLSVTIGNKQRGHQLDADNALKSLLDGLKRCGAIIDDSAEFLELGRVASVHDKTNHTIIILEDIEPLGESSPAVCVCPLCGHRTE
jgi:Holliday junction resolvase RusA-like endonuclease